MNLGVYLFLLIFFFSFIPFHWNIQFRYCKKCTLTLSIRYLFLHFHRNFTITDKTFFFWLHTFQKQKKIFKKTLFSHHTIKPIAKHFLYTYSFQFTLFFAWKNPYHLALLSGFLSAFKYTLLPPQLQKKFLFYQQFQPNESLLQINTALSFSLAQIIISIVSLLLQKIHIKFKEVFSWKNIPSIN